MLLSRPEFCMFLKQCCRQNYNNGLKRAYSRRSDSKTTSASYKTVKSTNLVNDGSNTELHEDPNWELLAPRGYRFLLPGSIGAACQGVSTTWAPEGALRKLVNVDQSSAEKLNITTSQCPVLLQKSLLEMFPHSAINKCTAFTVATLHKNIPHDDMCELDSEKIAMMFVYAAQELCTRLILSGYWADFINPFSGRPFNGPVSNNNKVYDPEEQFLCLGFSIDSKDKLCTIIKGEHEGQKFFKGNIFSDAPSHLETFLDIVKSFELENFK
ncbi:methylmalonic aciduria and homocystinuria type D homolog, mitochondrial-like [Ctenocephalides felis]|uniref:methylmalonic aciduria and homocystinuria type D homolog, mitochondrial-like n=1 Tax=Ctenocephalides felis TaxID=7515 RepID=UPI000E6E282D|nr:methylmalonic aciduria and homocystinuria type D homolog, mitochondrial-like [Ctenocephalides felis]